MAPLPKDESSPEGKVTLCGGGKIFRPAHRERDRSVASAKLLLSPPPLGGGSLRGHQYLHRGDRTVAPTL